MTISYQGNMFNREFERIIYDKKYFGYDEPKIAKMVYVCVRFCEFFR